MPPKGKKVHNTRSVSGTRSRSSSLLVVKVNNDIAKAKQSRQAKAKLKSIVKVVANNNSSSTAPKMVMFHQSDPDPPVDHQPAAMQMDAMVRWKLSMVAAINSCPSLPNIKSPAG